MPVFDDETISAAPPRAVWKILYDPLRFPDWWSGFETAIPGDVKGGRGDVTLYPEGYPDFPMPQVVQAHQAQQRVVVSCTISDLVFQWGLQPAPVGTRITVHVEIPEREAARLAAQQAVVSASLRRLAEIAEASEAPVEH